MSHIESGLLQSRINKGTSSSNNRQTTQGYLMFTIESLRSVQIRREIKKKTQEISRDSQERTITLK